MRTRIVPLLVLLFGAACGLTDYEAPEFGDGGVAGGFGPEAPVPVTVMTYNVYVGAPIEEIVLAPSPDVIPILVAETWGRIQQTDFPARARALAKEIVDADPDVVGLQEVSLFRYQSPGDFLGGNPQPAEEVVLDYLAEILDALAELGSDYAVAAVTQNFDLEVPILTPEYTLDDIRLTDFDVILARSHVGVENVETGNYTVNLEVPIGGPGGPVAVLTRGWAAIDMTVRGNDFRFVSTHLESDHPQVRLLQAQELLGMLATESRPIVLVGDFNADALTSEQTYQALLAAGFQDVALLPGADDGATCCSLPDLSNPDPIHATRIDLILTRGLGLETDKVQRYGEHPEDRTASGLWPSDHAGLKARLRSP